MRIKAFEMIEPLPKLEETQAIAIIEPWINAGNVGSMIFEELCNRYGAKELAKLARPGDFYDFTRYRPTLSLSKKSKPEVQIPNSNIRYASQEKGNDFIFLRLLEPHQQGELFVESILELLKKFNVKRYCHMGSMHGPVTYTRPLPITGGATGENVETILTGMEVEEGDYHGPTTIVFLVTQQAPELGIETMWLIVSLPSYFSLETDYIGKIRLMEILNYLYGISIFEADKKKAEEQLEYIKRIIKQYPQLQDLVTELETHYDAQEKKEKVQLPPEIEKMLEEIEKKGFSSQN